MGLSVATADFPQYEAWAERMISQITRGKVTETTFPQFPTLIQTAYQNAICAQISYFSVYGLDSAIAGLSSSGFTVGKVSVNADARFPVGKQSMICPAAISYLEQTGLLNPQVETPNGAYLPVWLGGGFFA